MEVLPDDTLGDWGKELAEKDIYSHLKSRKGRRTDAPRLYSPKVVEKICDLIIEGESTNRICKRKGMPSRTTLGKWLRKYPDFAQKFLEAKQIQTYFNVDDIREIAQDCDETSSASVQKARLIVDTLKWEATKMVPKIYGDKSSLEIAETTKVDEGRMEEIVSSVIKRLAAPEKQSGGTDGVIDMVGQP